MCSEYNLSTETSATTDAYLMQVGIKADPSCDHTWDLNDHKEVKTCRLKEDPNCSFLLNKRLPTDDEIRVMKFWKPMC